MLKRKALSNAGIGLFLAFFSTCIAVDVPIEQKGIVRIDICKENIFRIRLSQNGQFPLSSMERYGILHAETSDSNQYNGSESSVRVETATACLSLDKRTGQLSLMDKAGRPLISKIQLFDQTEDQNAERIKWLIGHFRAYDNQPESETLCLTGYKGQSAILGEPESSGKQTPSDHHADKTVSLNPFGAAFTIRENEKFYGLGAASSERIQHRGYAYRNWAEYKGQNGYDKAFAKFEQTEGPCPFLMSTGGWGVFVNTPALNYFDVASRKSDEVFFWGPQGELDFFLFVAESMPDIIDQYTQITGRPRLLPIWGYGLSYVGNIVQNQHESLYDALQFRERDIPCDIFGLEPQWMKKFYDFSHQKEWDNYGRFYMPEWLPREASMIGAMERMGLKLSLWLCVDDDLTVEEERQLAKKEGTLEQFPADAPEGWFEHLKKFVDQGVAAFKIDPSKIIETHFDRKYFNGQSDLQMHNLTQTLIQKQMQQGFENYTQRRAMVHFCGSYAGVQQFGATTMGDNGGGANALAWMLGLGFTGHMNTSCDMWVGGAGGMHFGFLMPWSQHNNWAGCEQPWYLTEEGLETYRQYAKLRYELIPYIYSTAHHGVRTGMPILRAMPLVSKDPECENLTHQYMLGDFLLSAVYTDEFYLPEGRWIDYWTGDVYKGPQKMKMISHENCGGALLIKAGAIIPKWPQINHISDKQFATLQLDVYPYGKSMFTLYEDDGISLEYQQGKIAQTKICSEDDNSKATLLIHHRIGSYNRMPEDRFYDIRFHMAKPKSVFINDVKLGEESIVYDAEKSILHIKAQEGNNDGPLSIVLLK